MKEEKNLVLEQDPEVLETVEFTIIPPEAGTPVSCSDPEGFDQTPVPEVISHSDAYFIDTIDSNGSTRQDVYWKTYNTLEYYSDIRFEAGNSYTVFGRVKAAPGYVFNDPVTLIINNEEVSSEEVEDYSMEGDSFTFYFDVRAE
ncbi:MAG: hypothetical protein II174_05045 [Erysipelotrichaceae bacterium]|nr:hypothetical protein [Erysipelotrichaceae bacterium]MBQ2079637.1 hypothetical protein [Erysipelotrichaceae bacterium]MBQ2138854.1 hypothetical protein [Erysipelotrichaceae bacterium]MBQ2505542.1 hypothetical protein [Erysipelotrichaceae bacterium]MBQ3962908.1 hypothetical protein [Erysipelotrichaceae bacterium]